MPIKLCTPAGTPITCWQEWSQPKRSCQWKEGRSAMCLAQAWFNDEGEVAVPAELQALLFSHPRLEGLQILTGVPEKVTALPERGEGRNHDLWLQGRTPADRVTICIEAKADEPFGNESVVEYRNRSLQRRNKGIPTRAPERIDSLLQLVGDKKGAIWADIPYQLLTAISGTVLQARIDESNCAVFIVHEFHTSLTDPDKLRGNAEAFEMFVRVLTGMPDREVQEGLLCAAGIMGGVEVLVGKVVGGIF